MKRFLIVFLILTLLFPLVSCASESGGSGSKAEEEKTLSEMSAEEFYAHGKEKNKALTSARYETKVYLGEEELYKIETVRIRSGYDGFSYSRSGDGYFCFAENTAFVENKHGKYQAPATSRSFEEYLAEYVFPLYGLDMKNIGNLTRKENQISYDSSAEDFLALYKELPLQGEFYPSELKGEANLSEEGIIFFEKLTLTGKDGKGEDHLFRVETELLEYRSDKITVSLPEKKEAFQVIQDIRIPEEMYAGNSALLSMDTFHSALVFSETVVLGEKTYSLNQDKDIYQVTDGEKTSVYFSAQSLKQVPKKAEESTFYQALTENGNGTENSYNLITGEKISEGVLKKGSDFYSEELNKILLNPADVKNIIKEEGSDSTSFRFDLGGNALQRVFESLSGALSESGITSSACTISQASGTITIDKESGVLSAVTYTLSGKVVIGGTEGTFSARYSLLTDPKEAVQLPAMQEPTPTTPGMEGEGEVIC